ncbi:hypothetical protein HAX54_046993 [Datura stramonium]|uniref:Uncharacterized protein n=1 Tax=Datura stramonium TaxID=4076 RepID=A0ABS8RTH6_DATST|nr:hypothetical protein [Datura stramonium]
MSKAKNQMLFSLPMIVVNSCFYLINLVSVMFAGHLGKLELAASNLANSWAVVTGFSVYGLAFKGASLAASHFDLISLLMLGLYVLLSKRFNHIWRDALSFEPFHYILTNLKLALPSAAMVCLEYWAFELLVLLAGLDAKFRTTTPVVAMCVNTQNIAYMISYGLSAAARGCGWQHLAMCINLATFYFIGMPIAGLLAFKFNLHPQRVLLLTKFGIAFGKIYDEGFMVGLDLWSSLAWLVATDIDDQMGKSKKSQQIAIEKMHTWLKLSSMNS